MSLDGIWITPASRQSVPDSGTNRRLGKRLAIKDLFDTAGVRTTFGSKVFADRIPDTTATAVELLEGAGWVSAGKANLHEFAYGITSQNPHYGTVPNPAFPGRTSGGSSGGCAAAIAVGEADLGLGTDTGGSIRIPAACCGITGFKPTFDLVPMSGCFPLAPSFDHAGPLAPDVEGCANAMRVLGGVEPAAVESLADLSIGLAWTEHSEIEVFRAVSEAVSLAVPRARKAELPLPEGVFPAFGHEVAGVHRDIYPANEHLYGDNVRTKVGRALDIADREAAAANAARERYRLAFAQAFVEFDLIVAPTLPVLPPSAEGDELDVRERMTHLTFPLNAVGAPSLAMPCGLSTDGRPVSLQLFGRPGDDALVLGAGAIVEGALRNTHALRNQPIDD